MSIPTGSFAIGISDIYLKNVANMDINIKNVFMCGGWGKTSKDSGFYRVILADYYYVGTEIYIQAIESVLTEKYRVKEKLLKTMTFPVFNNDHAEYYLENPVCKTIDNGMRVELDANHSHEDDDEYKGNRKVIIEIEGLNEPKVQILKPDAAKKPSK